jgi:hypothetical protein
VTSRPPPRPQRIGTPASPRRRRCRGTSSPGEKGLCGEGLYKRTDCTGTPVSQRRRPCRGTSSPGGAEISNSTCERFLRTEHPAIANCNTSVDGDLAERTVCTGLECARVEDKSAGSSPL